MYKWFISIKKKAILIYPVIERLSFNSLFKNVKELICLFMNWQFL